MKKDIYKPVAEIVFRTEEGDLVARNVANPGASRVDGDIFSIQTSREMGADSPTFSINLTRNKEWDKWIGSNDLIQISLQRPPETKRIVFFGLVDDARRTTITNDNVVERVITISGRGVSKAFIEFDIGYVPEAEPIELSIGWLEKNGVLLSGSTGDKIIEGVWDVIAKDTMNYSWGKNWKLLDFAQRKLSFRKNTVLLNSTSIMNWQGSMWAFMKKVADEPFHEIYWEVHNNKPTLMLRPTPFNKAEWNKLTKHEINDGDVVSDNVGKSDVETYSLFSVGMETAFDSEDLSKTAGIIPLWNEKFAKKYGIRRLDVETMYSATTDGDDNDGIKDLIERYQKDVYNWNIKNNSFYNGSIVVKGSNKYRIGDRLVYKSTEDNVTREYYIKNVNHTFIHFGYWTTELGVIRGIEPKKRFTSPVGDHETYKGLGLTEYNPDEAQGNFKSSFWSHGIESITGTFAGQAQDIIEIAKSFIGKVRYQMGGPGLLQGRADCSQFTQYCYREGAGIDLGRATGQQVQKGTKLGYDISSSGVSKNLGLAEPGDLVFFKNTYNSSWIHGVSHVGICLGNDQMIHLSSKGVAIDNIHGNSYWNRHFLMYRRVLNPETSMSSGSTSNMTGGRVYSMEATAYGGHTLNVMGGPGFVATWRTASGRYCKEGRTIAVDRNVIPLGTRVRVECSSYPSVNGVYVAEDTGGAIKGNKIDIYFDDSPPKDPRAAGRRMAQFGRRAVKVTILGTEFTGYQSNG